MSRFYRGIVLSTYRRRSAAYTGVLARVLLVDTGMILDDVLVPVHGAGGPNDYGITRLATCTPEQEKMVLEAIATGQPIDLTKLDGAWVLVSSISGTNLNFIAHRLANIRVAETALATTPTVPPFEIPVAGDFLIPDSPNISVPYPPDVQTEEDRMTWDVFYRAGFGVAQEEKVAGLSPRSDDQLRTDMASVNDTRWDATTQAPTLAGKAWLAGYHDGFATPLNPEPEPDATDIPPNERTDFPADSPGDGGEVAMQPAADEDYYEFQGVRVIVGKRGIVIDTRDADGTVAIQGPAVIIAGNTRVDVRSGRIVVTTDDVQVSADTVNFKASQITLNTPLCKVSGAINSGPVTAPSVTAGSVAATTLSIGGVPVPGSSFTGKIVITPQTSKTISVKNGMIMGVT